MIEVDGTIIATGEWGKNISWKLCQTSTPPSAELCTAVMCVAIADEKIVLACSERGWGMLGGHIEEGESLDDALRREAVEEGGFIIDQHKLFAVRKITAKIPEPARSGKNYPFPTSYIAYYWATTSRPLQAPTGEEILESGSFRRDEVGRLHTPDQPAIEAGWEAYAAYLTSGSRR